MEHLLNDTVRGLEISGIRKFFNLVGDQKDILSLQLGNPIFRLQLISKRQPNKP